jgi:ATP-dependent DNA helicase RecG
VANAFFRAGMIEAWGRGIERIMEACRAAEVPAPVWRYEHTGLWVEFAYRVRGEVTGEVGPQPESRPESRPESLEVGVLSLLARGPMAKAELSKGLGQKEVSGQLNKVVRRLLDDQTIEYTIPDKPNSRLQKYRLTEKGRAAVVGTGGPRA